MKNNTYKKILIFGAFAILFLGVNSAQASYPVSSNWSPYTTYYEYNGSGGANSNSNTNTNGYNPINTQQPTSNVVNNYYYAKPATTSTNTTSTTNSSNTATPTNNTLQRTNLNSSNTGNQFPQTGVVDNGSNLTALSLNGSGSFMPSSVWQWLIVIALILVIIIIARSMGKKQVPGDTHSVHSH